MREQTCARNARDHHKRRHGSQANCRQCLPTEGRKEESPGQKLQRYEGDGPHRAIEEVSVSHTNIMTPGQDQRRCQQDGPHAGCADQAETHLAQKHAARAGRHDLQHLGRPVFALGGECHCCAAECVHGRQRHGNDPRGRDPLGVVGVQQREEQQHQHDGETGDRQPEPSLGPVFFPDNAPQHGIGEDHGAAPRCGCFPGGSSSVRM